MHDTAFEIGSLAMNIYADLRTDSVLEIGALAVNGSLRKSALEITNYVGLDIEPGEGVDLVIEPGQPFPIQPGTFDLVIASSVFEHDSSFWLTFLEMCRATRDGGYIYVNAPSNGVVHRYPLDIWRFYPDAGKALSGWAASQGLPVALVESFIADRGEFVWNDFVAVFRKGPITKPAPKVFLHEHVACSNVITWKSNEILNPKEFPQDLELLEEAKQQLQTLQQGFDALQQEKDLHLARAAELTTQLLGEEQQNGQNSEVISKLQQNLEHSQAEVNAKISEAERLQEEKSAIQDELVKSSAELDALRAALLASEERVRKGMKLRADADAETERVQSELDALESRLQDRFREIAALTGILAERQKTESRFRADLDWLRETGIVLSDNSTNWTERLSRFLPMAFHGKRHRRLLKEHGLFDPQAYLAAHPDVAKSGIDPLRHYFAHGIAEGRRRG